MAGRLSAGRRRRAWPGVRPRHRGRRGGRGRERSSFGRSRTNQTSSEFVFASPDRIDAVVGPEKDRTLVTEEAPKRVTPAGRAVRERFAAATPETVDMPARSRPLAAACETLDDRFADDVGGGARRAPYGAVGRTGEVTDRTLLVALAARHDHLLWDLRRWIGDGADGERRRRRDRRWTGPHRRPASPSCGAALIEAIKMPAGDGRPQPRPGGRRRAAPRDARRGAQRAPRAVRAPGRRGRRVRQPPGRDERRPVWERTRRQELTPGSAPRTGMPNFRQGRTDLHQRDPRGVRGGRRRRDQPRARPARLPDAGPRAAGGDRCHRSREGRRLHRK